MSSIKLDNIHKSFGDNHIIKGIDLQINEGEFLVLVGPSGCGKSTLLRILSGLETPDKGNIRIDKTDVTYQPPAKRDLAMVFQNYALYPHLTVYENMAFGLRMHKKPDIEIKERIKKATKILQIEDLLDRKPKALSGGQRQRVAVGRAIVRNPKAYLFDEPLSNLDAKLRSEMRVELKKIHQLLGTTMVYVTHDQIEAMTMGDRIAILRDGVIEQLDTPKNIYNFPSNEFVASFVGSPQMNFFSGKIHIEDNNKIFKTGDLQFQLPSNHYQSDKINNGEDYIMGIRPENIHDNHLSEIKDPSNTIGVNVELVENIGSNLYIHSKVNNSPLIVSLSGSSQVSINDKIDFIFDMGKSHFFK